MPTDRRPLPLPVEGASALRETLLIMSEHLAFGDPHLFAEVSVRVQEVFTEEELAGLDSEDVRTIELSIAEADLLLDGLRFTEAASVDLPWYPMVVQTVRFVGEQLLGLFSDDEWLAWNAERPA